MTTRGHHGLLMADAGPAPWTPASLTVPPKIWLNDSSSVTDSGGGACSQWDDISGNGFHFSQPASPRPSIIASGLNGRRTIRFDGTEDFLRCQASGALDVMRNTGAGWMFCVVKKMALDGAATDRTIFMAPAGTGVNTARFVCSIGSASAANKPRLAVRREDGVGTTTLVATNAVDTNWHTLLFRMDWTNGDGFIEADGAADVQNLSLTTTGNTTNSASLTQLTVASSGGGTLGFGDIELAELIVGAGSLPSAGEITDLFTYADTRWGL